MYLWTMFYAPRRSTTPTTANSSGRYLALQASPLYWATCLGGGTVAKKRSKYIGWAEAELLITPTFIASILPNAFEGASPLGIGTAIFQADVSAGFINLSTHSSVAPAHRKSLKLYVLVFSIVTLIISIPGISFPIFLFISASIPP